jgi:hypothetical protein
VTLIAPTARRARTVMISAICLAGAISPAAHAGGSPSQLPSSARPCYFDGYRYEHGSVLFGAGGRARCNDGRWGTRYYA